MRLCYSVRCAIWGECAWVMCHIISWTYLEDIIPGEDTGTASWNIHLGRVTQWWQRDGMTEWYEVERVKITRKVFVCGKGSNIIETIHIFASANLIGITKWTVLYKWMILICTHKLSYNVSWDLREALSVITPNKTLRLSSEIKLIIWPSVPVVEVLCSNASLDIFCFTVPYLIFSKRASLNM